MRKILPVLLILPMLAVLAEGDEALQRVSLETTQGTIVLELEPAKAPITVANFLAYVRSGFYDGLIFHRCIPNFMIQGGGVGPDFEPRETKEPIVNEASNGLANARGTIAMARTSDIDSATSQFFINLKDNNSLDHRNSTSEGFGYCVFGRVVEGMDVVDRIAALPTGAGGPFPSDVPRETVTILRAAVTSP